MGIDGLSLHHRCRAHPGLDHDLAAAEALGGHNATKGDIRIGSAVWISAHLAILSGTIIGDGAVVGACAVVATDMPPYAIVVSNTARVVKSRFSPEVVAQDFGDSVVVVATGKNCEESRSALDRADRSVCGPTHR